MAGPWLSVKEAAQLMGYSPNYFRRTFCAKDKPLISITILNGRIQILQVEIEAFLEKQTRRPS